MIFGSEVLEDIEGTASIALEKVTFGRIEPAISSKTCCCSLLKNEIELCTSSQRFSKSMSYCDLLASESKSSCGVDSPNVEEGPVTMSER